MGTSFYLPTVESTLWEEETGTLMSDHDTRERFLNFLLIKEFRLFCWVDITDVRTEEELEIHRSAGWERWDQKMMGITDYL